MTDPKNAAETTMKLTIGAYLLARLSDMGIRHLFGVPGDYNLQFLEQVKDADGIDFVGTCNELNAAYAADGYARLNGASAVLTTYGVGELSAICGVAGACAEHVPVVCITGAPPLHAMEHNYCLHHTLADGNYDNMMTCYRQFTAAQTRLTPINAAAEIDRVLAACQREKKPVYIQLPSDVSYEVIRVPRNAPGLAFVSDPSSLEAALRHLLRMWSGARRPAILLDFDAERFGMVSPIKALVEKAQVPYANLTTAKCILDETHELWLGPYVGKGSQPLVRDRIEGSDCLIATAPRFIESNSGLFTQSLPEAATVMLHGDRVVIEGRTYTGIRADQLLQRFVEEIEPVTKAAGKVREPADWKAASGAPLTQARLWKQMAQFLKSDDVVVVENGTSNIGLSQEVLPAGIDYVASTIWAAIGYALPALLGTALAQPDRRQILVIGDGSFQLTAQELSTIQRLGLKPRIFLLNNAGYTIERFILGMKDAYNDVANWNYTKLPSVFADEDAYFSAKVTTEGELDAAIRQAEALDKLSLIEMQLDPFDAPEKLRTFGRATADFDYGPNGPQHHAAEMAGSPSGGKRAASIRRAFVPAV